MNTLIRSTILMLILLVPLVGHAIKDQFTVGVTVIGTDTEAPTTPTGVIATALSTTSIEVSWTASTDNTSVSGYVLTRDNAILATTSSTTYTDTGLTQSTTYSYIISAFDPSFNYSSTSATTSATTLSPTVATSTSTQETSTAANGPILTPVIPQFEGITIQSNETTTQISWKTDVQVEKIVRWGLTPDLELGSLRTTSPNEKHLVLLENLQPDTLYFYSIEIEESQFKRRNTLTGQFRTKALPDTTAPANVSNARIVQVGTQTARLTWKNPLDTDFQSVRIVRNSSFYPTDVYDGELIYEGALQAYSDDALQVNGRYHYALFAQDTNGNFSSGSLLTIQMRSKGSATTSVPVVPPFEDIATSTIVDISVDALLLQDFIFMQDSKKLSLIDNEIHVDGTKELTIILPYEKVPEVLKTITVTLTSPMDPDTHFTFLLRINKAVGDYRATIGALTDSGTYPLAIHVLDYKHERLKKLYGILQIASIGETDEARKIDMFGILLWLLIVLAPPTIVYILYRILNKKRSADVHEFISNAQK